MKNKFTREDNIFIKETLRLAKKGLGKTHPNPMVGAAIVKNGNVIAKGYHRQVGFPHAEIEAFKKITENLTGATLYVNLEPCSHYGKTPPCVDAIIRLGIKRVVFSTFDPNPKVSGKGAAKLKKANIDFVVGVLEKEARVLNEAFFTFHEKKRPFIVLKFAASLDGKIATKTYDSLWITSQKARKFSRKLRDNFQAILVGVNTVINDNPHLGGNQTQPLRIILDSSLRIPLNSKVLRDNNVLIATTENATKQKKSLLEKRGIQVILFRGNKVPLQKLMQELAKREIISVFVEGGGQTLGSFVDEKLVDKVYAFHAPILIGGKQAISIAGEGIGKLKEAISLKNVQRKTFDDTVVTVGYV